MTANILSEIVANTRREIEKAKALRPLETLQAEMRSLSREHRPFKKIFQDGAGLIAEIKPKSPSAGTLILHSPFDNAQGKPLEVADIYAKSSADAISVLTDEKYFGGSLQLLKDVRACVPQPILRKDFIIDEYQVYESELAGADAFLLIANILTTEELTNLIKVGSELQLDALVEVHDEKDLEKALEAGAELVGINNRDLDTLKIDLSTTERLVKEIPEGLPVISESGLESAGEVRKVRALGVRGILVGTSILKAANPLEKIQELKNAL